MCSHPQSVAVQRGQFVFPFLFELWSARSGMGDIVTKGDIVLGDTAKGT